MVDNILSSQCWASASYRLKAGFCVPLPSMLLMDCMSGVWDRIAGVRATPRRHDERTHRTFPDLSTAQGPEITPSNLGSERCLVDSRCVGRPKSVSKAFRDDGCSSAQPPSHVTNEVILGSR